MHKEEKNMVTLYFLLIALIVLGIAVRRWGAKSSDRGGREESDEELMAKTFSNIFEREVHYERSCRAH